MGRREGDDMTRAITKMFLARKRLGYSQADLAQKIGVTQPRISGWETRAVDMPPGRRKQIARVLTADPDTLTDDA